MSLDTTGNLMVNVAAAGTVGSLAPGSAEYIGVNISGSLTGVTGVSLTNAKAMTVAIVDGSGSQITSFGGGTQYSDGTTQATPTGTASLGKNPSNVLHALALDASGNLNVNLNANSFGTVTVSGAVTANQGGAPWSLNLTQVNSIALGSPSNYGTSPGAVSVAGVNAFVTNTVTVSGTVTTTPPSNASTNVVQWGGTNVSAATAGIPDINLKNVGNAAFTLGQQLAASSFPVVLTAAQLTTLTPLSTVTANQGGAPWTVKPDGTVWALTGTSANANVTNATLAVTQSAGPWTQNITQVGGSSISLGQASATTSLPVVIASNQSTLNVLDLADGSPGAATPAYAVLSGAQNGPSLRAVIADSSGKLVLAESGGASDTLTMMLMEIRALKSAIIALDKNLMPEDFEPGLYSDNTYLTSLS